MHHNPAAVTRGTYTVLRVLGWVILALAVLVTIILAASGGPTWLGGIAIGVGIIYVVFAPKRAPIAVSAYAGQTNVAGVSLRQPALKRLGIGPCDMLLVADVKNAADPNAVLVTTRRGPIGHLPAEIAPAYSHWLRSIAKPGTPARTHGEVGHWEKGFYAAVALPDMNSERLS